MSNTNCPSKNPLQRDGTSQYQRMLEALDPASANIHDFTIADWLRFAWHYAHKLEYYTIQNDQVPQGDWRNFMQAEADIQSFLQKNLAPNAPANVEPHLALFISFLQLMQEPQQQMNTLTKKHLDFYYKEVLQLAHRPAVEDRVYVIWELAKNITDFRLPDHTVLDGGKDAKGLNRQYLINDNPVIYPATVAALKSVYHKDGMHVRFAEVANSADGSGTPLKEENPSWFAFGLDEVPVEKDSLAKITLPNAKLGFSLASGVLLMKEGKRTIQITIDLAFPSGVNYTVFNLLKDQLKIFLTGEKGWVSPATVTMNKLPAAASQQWIFTVEIDPAEKAIINYDQKLHKENFNTDKPVIRILLETAQGKGYAAYAAFAKAIIKKVKLNVEVTGMKDIAVENDDGKLDPAKPFFPFGSMPRKDSNFYVGSAEIFQKPWKKIGLNIEWKNKPADLEKHYTAYRDKYLDEKFTRNKYDLLIENGVPYSKSSAVPVIKNNSFSVRLSYLKNNRWSTPEERDLFNQNPMELNQGNGMGYNYALNYGLMQLFITGYNSNKSYLQNYVMASPMNMLFSYATFNPGYLLADANTGAFSAGTKNNFLRLQLVRDFMHTQFPVLYAAAMSNPGAVLPKEPYTPMIAGLSINYSTEVENDFQIAAATNESKLDNYRQRNVQLFHEAPFGQSEQHVFLKEQQAFLSDQANLNLVPVYKSEGEFYIGVNNAIPQTILNLLCQVAEGSENPVAPEFEAEKPIAWSVLCNNEWKPLNADFILSDDTNNFLRPGIVQILLPKETTKGNTVLPGEFTWLKAALPTGIPFDAVCKFIAVIAQATTAVFEDHENDLTHLATALPAGTISKSMIRYSAIKSLQQPFNSFGGSAAESDQHFYIRVSERLRHKKRAVQIWDYERLILEQFPSVYKVKCLNHTNTTFELAPGCVRIIPVPDIRNKNIYNIYEPRVSKNRLREIELYLKDIQSFHIDCKAENPEFEPVKFDFKVKFHENFDPIAHAKLLNETLKRYLSPWAFDDYAEIQFGGALYKSRVIAFIEELKYVDFITDFKMYNMKFGATDNDAIMADNSRAILTSYKEHSITPIQPPVCP